MARKVTTESFIERTKLVHGDKYDYSKVEYTGKDNKVCIICPEHGEFLLIANNHVRGSGCPKCGVKRTSASKFKDTETFIKKAREIYGDKYDYSKSVYKGSKELITITCRIHGDFLIPAGNHLNSGCGCKKCSSALKGLYKKLNTEQFIEKANKVHNNFYNYEKTNYVLSNLKVIITCPIHGDFELTPNHHLGGEGCPVCKQSKGERLIESILLKYNIPFKREVTFHVNEIVKIERNLELILLLNLIINYILLNIMDVSIMNLQNFLEENLNLYYNKNVILMLEVLLTETKIKLLYLKYLIN